MRILVILGISLGLSCPTFAQISAPSAQLPPRIASPRNQTKPKVTATEECQKALASNEMGDLAAVLQEEEKVEAEDRASGTTRRIVLEGLLDSSKVKAINDDWPNLLALVSKCHIKAEVAGDKSWQDFAIGAKLLLWQFRADYFQNAHNTAINNGAAVAEQISKELADLQQRYAALQSRLSAPPTLGPLFERPTPIEMECIGTKCDGEILSPRPLPIVPFHMTCRVIVGKVQCDGDLMP